MSTASQITAITSSLTPVNLTTLGSVPGSRWKNTGVSFSTVIVRHIPPEMGKPGQTVKNPATWYLWEIPRQLSSKNDRGPMVMYTWSARDPNPDAMTTKIVRIEDNYKPPVGTTIEESKTKAVEWAKQFALPSPEQQGENLAKLLEQMQATGRPAPSYDPVVTAYTPEKSKLPLIIGGVAAVAVIAALWWKFRKH